MCLHYGQILTIYDFPDILSAAGIPISACRVYRSAVNRSVDARRGCMMLFRIFS
jgi:hypothetical protein